MHFKMSSVTSRLSLHFHNYPESRPVFHLHGEQMLLIKAETTTTPATMKMVQIESLSAMSGTRCQ